MIPAVMLPGSDADYHDERRRWWDSNAVFWSHYLEQATAHLSVFEIIEEDIARWHERAGKPMSLFDLGFGDGTFLRRMRARFPDAELSGIDFSDGMVSLARESSPDSDIVFGRGDFETGTGIPKGTSQYVTAILSFAEAADLDASFDTASRLLQPDGVCVVVYLDAVVDIARHAEDMPRAEALSPMLFSGGFVYTRHFRFGHEKSPAPYSRVVRLEQEYERAAARHSLIPMQKRWIGGHPLAERMPPVYCVTYFQKT